MAGGGVSRNIYGVFLEPPRRGRSGCDLLHFREGFEIKMNFDRNVSCLFAVDMFMDNDFFNQAVECGGVQFRDVGIFLNGLHPLAGVTRKPDFIGQLLPAFLNPFAFNSACSFCVFSISRLKFASLIRPATICSRDVWSGRTCPKGTGARPAA